MVKINDSQNFGDDSYFPSCEPSTGTLNSEMDSKLNVLKIKEPLKINMSTKTKKANSLIHFLRGIQGQH